MTQSEQQEHVQAALGYIELAKRELSALPNNRELALAQTKLDEARHWVLDAPVASEPGEGGTDGG